MANWRDRYRPPPDPPPGLVWRESSTTAWTGFVGGNLRARLYHGVDGWQVQLQLETPAGTSPTTTLAGRFGTAEEAQQAAEERLAERFELAPPEVDDSLERRSRRST